MTTRSRVPDGTPLRARLRSGVPVLGTFNPLLDPAVTELVGLVGIDAVVLDLEHGPGSIVDAAGAARAAAAGGAHLVVRTALSADIPRALDVGADGVMVPMVTDALEARTAVSAARFPPAGRRGLAGSHRAAGYGTRSLPEVVTAADETAVIVQVETQKAMHNVDSIAAVDGIDALFLGPTDLASEVGMIASAADDGWFRQQVRSVARAASAAGASSGTLVTTERQATIALEAGMTFITWSTTIGLLRQALLQVHEGWQQSVGER